RTIAGSPIQVLVASDASLQARYAYSPPVIPTGQFFPPDRDLADMGAFLWAGSAAYGPNLGARSSAYGLPPVALTEEGQTGPTGSGSAADPFVVITTLAAGATGLQLVLTTTYINGQSLLRVDALIRNTGASAQTVTYFLAGDLNLKGSDQSFGSYDA